MADNELGILPTQIALRAVEHDTEITVEYSPEVRKMTVTERRTDGTIRQVMKAIDVSHLPPDAIDAIERLVRTYPRPAESRRPSVPLGYLRDGYQVPDAFLKPLSDEELRLWEEGHEADPLQGLYK